MSRGKLALAGFVFAECGFCLNLPHPDSTLPIFDNLLILLGIPVLNCDDVASGLRDARYR